MEPENKIDSTKEVVCLKNTSGFPRTGDTTVNKPTAQLVLEIGEVPYPEFLDINDKSIFLFLHLLQIKARKAIKKHHKRFSSIIAILALTGYAVYFGFAINYSVEGAKALIIITSLVVALIIYAAIKKRYGKIINDQVGKPMTQYYGDQRQKVKWLIYPLITIVILTYMVLSVYKNQKQLVSLGGMIVLLIIPLVSSKHVTRIQWRPVVWGMGLQFALGVCVLRFRPGFIAIKFVTDELNKFLSYSLAGAAMAFGDPWFFLHPLVFLVSSIVIFIGGLMGVAFHLGLTQALVSKMAWLMRHSMGTTGIESVSIAANIFFSVLDSIQMFKSYIPKLTKSEFHTFSVGAHCTIAGFAYGLFVIFGASPQHLLTAAAMSAPAAVAISKLSYPETEESHFKDEDDCKIEPRHEGNVMEAISDGALASAKMIMTLIVQVIVFMALFEWLDVTVVWLGARVGVDITLRTIFSYLFLPFGYMIGVDPEDVKKVSSVVGLKLVTSEFLAFIELGKLRAAREISERSAAIATYAICGFSSIGSLFMMANVWGVVSKQRARDAMQQLPRVYINCNIACFLTACVAGILYSEDVLEEDGGQQRSILAEIIFTIIPSYKDILKLL